MTDIIKILVVDDNKETRNSIKKILAFDSRMDIVAEAENGFDAIDMASKFRPDVILMDINMPKLDGIKATEEITIRYPTISIIVISVQGEQEYLKRAMLAGAKEYLIKPFTSDEVIQAILNVYERSKQRIKNVYAHQILEQGLVHTSKLIAVFSGKGGVGKSLIAANIAVSLVKKNKKVVIIDLDLVFGVIATLFNLKVKETIYHLVQDIERLDSDSINQYLLKTDQGVNVLAAPTRPEQSELITGKHVEKIIRLLRETHDYIILDSPSQLTDPVLTLEQSDFVLLVNTLNITAIKNNKIFLEIMQSLNMSNDKVRLLINRVGTDTGVKIKDIEEILGIPPYAILPEEKMVDISINCGKPFIGMKPYNKWSKKIDKLVSRILAEDERKISSKKTLLRLKTK